MKIGEYQVTSLTITEGSILDQSVDAIVNAANSKLERGGGVCGQIYRAAGEKELQLATQKVLREKGWDELPTGESVITDAFNLNKKGIKYIIHTVGPIRRIEGNECHSLLEACLRTSLRLAEKQEDIQSIAYPLIGTGSYGVPVPIFARAASSTMRSFPYKNIKDVRIVVFNDPDSVELINKYFCPLW